MNIKNYKTEKLQKILARCGYGSRMKIEEFIKSGRIRINNKLAVLGDRLEIKANTKIYLDDRLLIIKRANKIICRVLVYYKKEGEICTNYDTIGRQIILNQLPKLNYSRWISIGRLDINTSGLLLFTTDGELANKLMHPSYNIEREYVVRVFGKINDNKINQLTKGIQLNDGNAKFKTIKFYGGDGMNKWFNVTLTEGRNREVRRLWESVGIQVSRLIRIRYGTVYLPRWLSRGKLIELNISQINCLRQLVNL